MPDTKPTLLQLLALPKVLPDAQQRLEKRYHCLKLWEADDPNQLMRDHGEEVEVLLTSAFHAARAALIDQLPNLKAICSLGVGYDSIDIGHAHAHGIQVSNTPDVLNDCVADLTWGLILSTLRGMGHAERFVREGKWESQLATLPLGRRVTGKRLGIVGLGRVGLAVAQRASGFEMDLRYHNRRPRNDVAWTYESDLLALADWCDILVVATVGGPETRHLINQRVLESLGPEGVLINVARGSVVDEKALIEALAHGTIAAAGLDVFESEPHVPEALKALDNVVLMPHIASATLETRQAMVNLVVENAESYARSGKVLTPVPQAAAIKKPG
ncbi:2-hydroxyacid dehydrogenase [Pusillimonas noertemannii]|uniref:Lactate dehydrogenase-like 2-hydroxyacid dehydrogenase n=1 Tax=Pusillimonas noertemannii TaxID=305977 RepID=A0A2U1CJA3_9BURK|nr:2-hydroxyacid dehydrogenase [Pusillimonas noertemannii]NYT70119.1 2-hydroxyacid dehydrogenase [Pusillimonas noertemannii]PVY61064.1 lactate dehydrogenase-like 2-hydroxyacid dehydrogenase [Pusillimonas noertemannii]TFL08283.1 2-hydroxyacid dehydrogenase [Pusillimonas noertemannii]